MGYKLSCCDSLWSDNNVLFKSVLGHCAVPLLPKNLPSLHNTALIKIPDLILVCVIEDLF